MVWRERDPLLVARKRLAGHENELDAMDARAREQAEQAVERALAAPPPDPKEAFAHVFSD